MVGVQLTLLIGPTVPVPAPPHIAEAIDTVEVSRRDEGQSGFQITFQVGRQGPAGIVDYALVMNPLLRPFSRAMVLVTMSGVPQVLMDGFITNQQLSPGTEPGTSSFTVTGDDVSVKMDLDAKTVEHPAQPEMLIALKLIASYPQLGLVPVVIPPPSVDVPLPIQRTPVQQGTDLSYLRSMAARFGYAFYVTPGPVPGVNRAYWGPPERIGLPQRALSVNMGPATNVDSIDFQYNALAPTTVSGRVQDSTSNQTLPVRTFVSTRPPLSSQPALLANQPNVRNTELGSIQSNAGREGTAEERVNMLGLTYLQAFARAQGVTDKSTDNVVTATGQLDALRYGGILQPRGLVGLRGAGYSHDGIYYVKSVTHRIKKGEYRQSFTLARDGLGSLTPVVLP